MRIFAAEVCRCRTLSLSIRQPETAAQEKKLKIISKFKDYCDYLAGVYGEDPLLVSDLRDDHPLFMLIEMRDGQTCHVYDTSAAKVL